MTRSVEENESESASESESGSASTTKPSHELVWTVCALITLGLALALTHLAVSLEISVTLSHHGPLVKSLLLFL